MTINKVQGLDTTMEENQYEPSEDPSEEVNEPYSGSYLLQTIWTHPRWVIRYLADFEPTKYVILLLVLNGVSSMLQQGMNTQWGLKLETTSVILIGVLVGPIVGLLSGYITSVLLSVSGKWMDGKANSEQIRLVLAWSSVPSVLILGLLFVGFLLLGEEFFVQQKLAIETQPLLAGLLGLVAMALAIWSFVLLLVGLSEIQEFSVWKALLNLMFTLLMLLAPVILLLTLLMGSSGLTP